jgi:hypothetical protein
MTIAASECWLLTLPTELLYSITEFTRPFDFENFLLSCKSIYEIGESIIADHNYCKGWRAHRASVSYILGALTRSSRRHQNWLLEYVECFEPRDANWVACDRQLLLPKLEEMPWVEKQLHRIVEEYPQTRKYLETDLENDYAEDFYRLSFFLLLSNLRRLSLPCLPSAQQDLTLMSVIRRDQGQRYFRKLEEVRLDSLAFESLDDISTWLLLPTLRVLATMRLSTTYNGIVTSSSPPGKFSLEHVVFLECTMAAELIVNMLETFPSLRTFIFENNIPLPQDCPESYEILPSKSRTCHTLSRSEDQTLHIPIRDQDVLLTVEDVNIRREASNSADSYEPVESLEEAREGWIPLSFYESDTSEGYADENRTSSKNNEDTFEFFNPKKLVQSLERNLQHTIEHLAISNTTQETMIPRENQIIDLKSFSKLTHLELDTQFLHPLTGALIGGSVPRSITRVLPASIQVLGLHFRDGDFRQFYQMLRKLPSEHAKFPALRLVVIKFVDSDQNYETWTRMLPLQEQFEEIGIALQLKGYGRNRRLRSATWLGLRFPAFEEADDISGLDIKYFTSDRRTLI